MLTKINAAYIVGTTSYYGNEYTFQASDEDHNPNTYFNFNHPFMQAAEQLVEDINKA